MQACMWYGKANTVGEDFKFSRKYEDLVSDCNDKSREDAGTSTKREEAELSSTKVCFK